MKTLTKTLLAATFAIASFSAFADTEIDLTKYEGEWKFDSQSVAAKHFPKTANLSITLQEENKKKCGKSVYHTEVNGELGERIHQSLEDVVTTSEESEKFTALVEEGKKIFKAKSIYPLFVEVCDEDVFLFNLNSEKEGIVVKVNPQKMEKAYISKVFR